MFPYNDGMLELRKCFVAVSTACTIVLTSWAGPAGALDVILFEELKEGAIEYGKISQRFVTCQIEPPYSVRTAYLKFAKYQGASPQHLEILSKIFDEGAARVRNLKSGFSEEECKAKLESPRGQELLEQIRKWGAVSVD